MAAAKKKVVKKKTAAKKKVVKKAAAKKAAPAKNIKAISTAYSKTQLFSHIAENTGVARKDVAKVFDCLNDVIEGHVMNRGAGEFKVPGLMKIKINKKPATKARKNVPNPFRPGEMMDVKAKPARKVVKVLPLKALKDMVAK